MSSIDIFPWNDNFATGIERIAAYPDPLDLSGSGY